MPQPDSPLSKSVLVDGSLTPGLRAKTLTVRGIAPNGKAVTLLLQADSAADAVRLVTARGIRVSEVRGEEEGRSKTGAPENAASRGGAFPLLLFSQELLALLDAGLNLMEALATLCAKERRPGVRAELARIVEALREGRNLSDVLADAPSMFPEVYVATVRASERTGDLGRALKRYIAYQVQFDDIRKKIVSAAIYPAALLAVGALVFLFLLGYVVPRFSVVYDTAGRNIPWLSMVMMGFGKFIHANWQWVGFGALAFGIASAWGLSQPHVRRWLLEAVLRLPWLALKSEEFRLARFYRAVSLLLASGVALPKAMGMVNGLLSNAQQARLSGARLAVQQGQSLSTSLLAAGLASPVAESLMRVGERTGQMAEMLERTAMFHDDEFARWIDWASRLMEPILMSIIGVVIGAVVLLMYMPIFDLAGSLQ